MRKIMFFTYIFSFSLIFAQNKIGWEGTASGEYIVYKDASWKDETYVGFLYYNSSSIGSFLYIPAKNVRATILFSVKDDKGSLVLEGQKITSPQNNDSTYILAINYLMELLPSFYEKKIRPQDKSKVIRRGQKTFNTDQFGASATFYYASYVPFFYLESVADAKGNEVLSIEKIGRIREGQEHLFFSFEPIKEMDAKTKPKDMTFNQNAKKETVLVEGLSFKLDSQWTKIADNSFFMGDVAFLTVNRVKKEQFDTIHGDVDSSLIKLFSISRAETKMFYDKRELTTLENGFLFSTLQYDSITQKKIKDIKRIIKEGDDIIIISLTVDHTYYACHALYFNSLF